MQVFGVAGPPSERRAAAERLVAHLGDQGRVGVIDGTDSGSAPDDLETLRAAGSTVVYAVDGDGWTARGEPTSLDELLDDLAPTCAYAVVLGRPEAALPQVVVGDRAVEGRVLVRVEDTDGLDLHEVTDHVDDLEPRETLESLVERVKRSPEEIYAGAIATFTGRVRAKDDPEDDYTEHLAFERYDDVVEQKMAEIRSTLEARDGVYEVRLHHRTGVMEAGEDIVFVVVLAGHRNEAFETVEDGIDRLKEVVPLFKKEVTVEGEFWAHERD